MILKVYSAFKGDFSSLLFKKEDTSNRERERVNCNDGFLWIMLCVGWDSSSEITGL